MINYTDTRNKTLRLSLGWSVVVNHSLTWTMAFSEHSLKDAVQMLIDCTVM